VGLVSNLMIDYTAFYTRMSSVFIGGCRTARLIEMLTSLNRYDFQPHHFRSVLIFYQSELIDEFSTSSAAVTSR